MAAADQMVALCVDDEESAGASDCFAPLPRSEAAWPIRAAIVRARSALISMKLEEASKAIAELNRLLSTCRPAEFLRYSPALRILRASRLAVEDDFAGARSILATLPLAAGNTIAATILRYAEWRCGECVPSAADPLDWFAFAVGGRAIDRIYGLCMSAALAFDRLHLTVSAALATEALELARRRGGNQSPLTCLPATLLAQVAYQQGRFDEAEALLRPRMSVIRLSGMPECIVRAGVLLARISLHRGRHTSALALVRELVALGRARRWSESLGIASAEYGRALQAIRSPDERAPELWASTRAERADTRADCRDSPTLLRLIPRRRFAPVPSNEPLSFSAIERALQRACSAAADGRIDDGYELLVKCLHTGATHGLRMVFADAGPQVFPLLAGLHRAIPLNHPQLADLRPYIVTLLRSRAPAQTEETAAADYRSLSRREAGILQMIARGMSNKSIARSLGITPETVKTHAKSIFTKLETRTRAHAVARAEAIGLL